MSTILCHDFLALLLFFSTLSQHTLHQKCPFTVSQVIGQVVLENRAALGYNPIP